MNKEDIKKIIREELKNEPDLSNAHGVDIKGCLIEPENDIYINSMNKNERLKLWTVLEETEDKNGYKIIYNPSDNLFGLGMKTKENELIYLGSYGSFADTLNNMWISIN